MMPYQICGSARPAYLPRTASALLASSAKAFSCSAAGRWYLICAHSVCSALMSSSRPANAASGMAMNAARISFFMKFLRGGCVASDGGKLAQERTVDEAGQDLVQAREQPLRHAEQPLAHRPLEEREELLRHGGGLVHRHAELGVERTDARAVHRGARRTRREVEHAHRAVGELAAQRLAEAAQRELARAVGGVAGIAEVAHDRADVHDPGLGLALELGQQAPRELHRREDIGLDDARERGVALAFEPGELARAGVVDEEIDARKLDRVEALRRREVRGERARDRPRRGGAFGEPAGIAAHEHEIVAMRRERPGDLESDPAARSGKKGTVALHDGSPRKMSP